MNFNVLLCAVLAFVCCCNGVRVTLLNGAASPLPIEVTLGNPITLACSFQPESGTAADSRLEWLYSTNMVGTSTSGQNIVLDGIIQPNFNNGRFSIVNPSSLQISESIITDTGSYTCLVTLPHDTPSKGSGTYHLTVNVPPSPPQCQYTSDHALTIGFAAEFRCSSIEGVPTPTYTWFKNGRQLPLSAQDDITYKNASFSYSVTTGVLKFSKVTTGDAGTYYCSSSNKIATESCLPTVITTKNQDVGMIVGIVFGVLFGLILIGVLVWWTWRKGYCDGLSKEDDPDEIEDDGSNDIMLDTNGPTVHKPPSEVSSTRKPYPDGAVRVMP
ncbi:junctional adhesion molecule 3B-like isoform X1 [Ciona intestinalis]